MPGKKHTFFITIIFALVNLIYSQESVKSLNVVRTSSPVIDGVLNETVWMTSKIASGFIQTDPVEGAPASEKTEVMILYDEKNLYFGIKCYDSEPDKIIATEMRRDSQFENDDVIIIFLDTYHDHRNAFTFAVNPLGAKSDAQITDEGASINFDWNGIWFCDVKRTDIGWTAEIAVPFNTLRFEQKEENTFGFNILRLIPRKREESYWSPISRDFGMLRPLKVSAYGELHGLKNIRHTQNFELKPYVLPGISRDFEEEDQYNNELKTGIDLKYKITSNLIADITYNTDFAQVEADEERVNLTRFDLFFPEKREFFLEGADIFTFGERADIFGSPERNLLFFSRRIGISDDSEMIPIIGGAKITGKSGKYNLGVLNLTTNKTSYYNDDDEHVNINKTNFTVLRTKRDILAKSSVGMIFLNKDAMNSNNYDRGLGLDFDLNFYRNLNLRGYLAKNYSGLKTDKNTSGYMDFKWGSDLHEINISYLDVGENFDPEMGFIPRTDIKRTKANFSYSPRPKILSLRQTYVFNNFTYLTDHSNKLLTRENMMGAFLIFENGSNLIFGHFDNYEFLDESFEIRDGVEIPIGIYKYNSNYLSFQSDGTKNIWVNAENMNGGFLSGKINSLNIN
ncbi:DUF5916 domain-containing protein [candidate division KSB1 bacterium]